MDWKDLCLTFRSNQKHLSVYCSVLIGDLPAHHGVGKAPPPSFSVHTVWPITGHHLRHSDLLCTLYHVDQRSPASQWFLSFSSQEGYLRGFGHLLYLRTIWNVCVSPFGGPISPASQWYLLSPSGIQLWALPRTHYWNICVLHTYTVIKRLFDKLSG